MDNKKLAEIIYGLAQYEGYNTSFLQTQKISQANLKSGSSQMKMTIIFLKTF
ncbi:MAG: hypothetical protein ACRCXQ_10235 [Vagococcus fluvialis]